MLRNDDDATDASCDKYDKDDDHDGNANTYGNYDEGDNDDHDDDTKNGNCDTNGGNNDEHDNNNLKAGTLNTLTAAQKLNSDVDLFIAGNNLSDVINEAKTIDGINQIIAVES